MNDYELIMVVLGIIGAIFTSLIVGYKFGSKNNRRASQTLAVIR